MSCSSRAIRSRSSWTARRERSSRSASWSRAFSSIAAAYRRRVRAQSPRATTTPTERSVVMVPGIAACEPPFPMITPRNVTATARPAPSPTRRSRRSTTVKSATSAPRLSLTTWPCTSVAWAAVAASVTTRTAIGHRRRTISGSVSRRSSVTLSGSPFPTSVAPLASERSDRPARPKAIVPSMSQGSQGRGACARVVTFAAYVPRGASCPAAVTGRGQRLSEIRGRHLAAVAGASRRPLFVLDDRDDVPERVLEPGDRHAAAAQDPVLVGDDRVFVVLLHPDAGPVQIADCRLDVGDVDVQDGEGRRLVIGLRVDEDRCAARPMDLEDARFVPVADVQPERRAVEASRLVGVLHGEAAEDRSLLEHH